MITELQQYNPVKREWITIKVIKGNGDSDRFYIPAMTESIKIRINEPTKFRAKVTKEWTLYPEEKK